MQLPKKENSVIPFNKKILLLYTIVPSVALTFPAILSFDPELWRIQGIDHFYFEMVSVILATIVAIYAIARGYTLKDKLSLFIGLGFFISAIIDLLHGTFAVLNLGNTAFEGYFIPQTWVAGRILMSIVMVIAVVKFGHARENTSKSGSLRKEIVIYTSFLSVIAAVITIISLSQPLPFLTIDFIIRRPYEMAAAILFAISIIFFYKRKLYAINDTFFKGFLLALIIDVFVNLIISYSSSVFDTAFNIAHVLKNVSYFVFIITLSSSAIFHYTLKEKLADELKEIDTKKEEFTSMVTHELKTPLTPILGWLSVLDKGDLLGTLNDKQKTAVRKILTNSRRLNNLISDLLDAQKLDLGKMSYDITTVDINSMITDLVDNFQPTADTKKIKIFDSTTETLEIKSDKSRIEQVINNLVYNAIDFVPNDTGTIEIKAHISDTNLIISIKDNGKGVNKEDQEHLFKKFYQADTSATRKHGGTGLGLSICSGICEGLGGNMSLISSVQNHETIFFISLPV